MKLLSIVAALVVGATSATPALAQETLETFVCESNNGRHNECRYRSAGIVTVHVNRQFSRERCVFNENWGTFDGGVWVDSGCRAEFVVRRPPGTPAPRPSGGAARTVVCESQDQKRRECRVDDIDPSTVHVERRISGADCTQGVSWGPTDRGIWTDNGCRAVFAYRTRGSSWTPYGGTPYDRELPCESLRGEWTHCDVPDMHVARVERIAGNDACNAYKAWGVDDTGIWVRNNCQGAFRVRYRH